MNIDELKNGGARKSPQDSAPSTRFNYDALPEVQKPVLAVKSQTGVSTSNGLNTTKLNESKNTGRHWYALRTTYGREKKAYEYLLAHNITAYYPTVTIDKLINGRIKSVEVSRIPNIFFAYGTEEEIKEFVYDNVHLPFLRFYYRKHGNGADATKEPLIIPDRQMESLRIVCETENEDTIVTSENIIKFQHGQKVHVTAGPFAGVTGVVSRYKGQQRIGISIEGVVTAITAYVPSGMMEKI